MTEYKLILGDCLKELNQIEDDSIDSILSDPPYPGIERSYGYWTEPEWLAMMQEVVKQSRRILKPKGSAVFILQPNSEKVGRMRLWLWEFIVWAGKEWNIIQDAYWWNMATLPTVHCNRHNQLMRPSVKFCLWLGESNCYRNQQEVLWAESIEKSESRLSNDLKYRPSGYSMRESRIKITSQERGGVTPFNILPISGSTGTDSPGGYKHGAGTPLKLTKWWLKYITKPNGLVLDMFSGTGTTGVAAKQLGFDYVGIERIEEYQKVAEYRIKHALTKSKPDHYFADKEDTEQVNLF